MDGNRQVRATVSVDRALLMGVSVFDQWFYPGFAKRHPHLVALFLKELATLKYRTVEAVDDISNGIARRFKQSQERSPAQKGGRG
jgi:predicted amidohydrolase YtcJ